MGVVWDAEMKFYFWDVKGRWVRMRFHKMVSFLLLSFRILVGMEGGLLYIELVMMMVIVVTSLIWCLSARCGCGCGCGEAETVAHMVEYETEIATETARNR